MEQTMKERLEKFIQTRKIQKGLRRLTAAGQRSLVIDFDELLEFDMELSKHLLENPTDFLETVDALLGERTKVLDLRFRVKGLTERIKIRKIRAEEVGKFIQVEGILTRASEVKPEAREAVFKCRWCGEDNHVLQADEFFREPLVCENPLCLKRGRFELVVERTVFCDWQSLRVQERPEELRGGRMPRQLDGIVKDDFVDRAVPGNHVLLTGTLRVFQEIFGKRQRTTFRKILFVNHIEVIQKGVEETELSEEDEARIEGLKKDPLVRTRIIQSIAPSIHGHEAIKEGMALQLFGCDPLDLPDGTRVRGDSHILLTGDPGVAKSQMLTWVAQVAPRGLYTSGKKATGPGLTAAAIRDEIGGGWTLEAGALVITDGGLCCVDEFDKMSDEDRSAILEALEQQTISVAKAGIVATLNARTSVVAAANPKGGRLDRYRNLIEQIALDPVILSRFDLIFVMRDEPHHERDRTIARHMLELHRKPKEVVSPPLDTETIRKLIVYARKLLHPKLEGEEVMRTIEDFYVKCREVAERGEAPVPITPRQLEALIRLTKANARMRLSDKTTVEDANCAIRLISHYISEASVDTETKTPRVDIDLIMTGRSKSQRERIQRVLDIIKELEREYGGAAPIKEVKNVAGREGIGDTFVQRIIDEELKRGHLYEPKPEFLTRVVKT